MKKFGRYSVSLITGLIVSASVAADEIKREDTKISLDKAEQWEKAASVRELAAGTEQMQADDLLANAQDLQQTNEYESDAERIADLRKVGDLQRMAGDLYGLSVANYDRAVANWNAAAEEYGKYKELERQRNARNKVDIARRNAVLACVKTAETYELAAEAFSLENGNDPSKAGQALERTAAWRENLATRK